MLLKRAKSSPALRKQENELKARYDHICSTRQQEKVKLERRRAESAKCRVTNREHFLNSLSFPGRQGICKDLQSAPVTCQPDQYVLATGTTQDTRLGLCNLLREPDVELLLTSRNNCPQNLSLSIDLERYNAKYYVVAEKVNEPISTKNAIFITRNDSLDSSCVDAELECLSLQENCLEESSSQQTFPLIKPQRVDINVQLPKLSIPEFSLSLCKPDPENCVMIDVPSPGSADQPASANVTLQPARSNNLTIKDGARSRPSSARSRRSSRSARSSISQAKPKDHWVDKITVSSAVESRKSPRSQAPSFKNDQGNSEAGSYKKSLNQPQISTDQVALPSPSLEKPHLPSYICPSSEEKSREFTCRVWVARSKFDTAIHTLPLY